MAENIEHIATLQQSAPSLNDRLLGRLQHISYLTQLCRTDIVTERVDSVDTHGSGSPEVHNDSLAALAEAGPEANAVARNDITSHAGSLTADAKVPGPFTAATGSRPVEPQASKESGENTLSDDPKSPKVTGPNVSVNSSDAGERRTASLSKICPKTIQCEHCKIDERLSKLENTFDSSVLPPQVKRVLELMGYTGLDDSPAQSKDPVSNHRISPTPKPNFMTVQAYRDRNKDPDFSLAKPHFTFDAVYTDFKSKDLDLASGSIETAGEKLIGSTGDKLQIRFIQVNSAALQAIFHQLGDSAPQSPVKPLLIFSPFKSLCYRSDRLQEHLDQLKESMQR